MASCIISARRSTNPDLLKPADSDLRRTFDRFSVDQGIWTQEQSQSLGVEAVIGIMEILVEIVDAKQQLIGHPRGKN